MAKNIVGMWVRAKVPTINGWKGVGVVVQQSIDVVHIVPEGEDITDRWKQKTYLRYQVSVLRDQNR